MEAQYVDRPRAVRAHTDVPSSPGFQSGCAHRSSVGRPQLITGGTGDLVEDGGYVFNERRLAGHPLPSPSDCRVKCSVPYLIYQASQLTSGMRASRTLLEMDEEHVGEDCKL